MPNVTVKDALAKLKFLASDRTAAERGGYEANWSAFARRIADERLIRSIDTEHAGNNFRNTLSSAAANDRVDSDTEKIVAGLCRFNAACNSWRSEGAQTFRKDFKREQFKAVRLRSWSIAMPVSVEMFFSANTAGDPWSFDVEVVCQKLIVPDTAQLIIIRRGALSIVWDKEKHTGTHAESADKRNQILDKLKADLEGRGVEATVLGQSTDPHWHLDQTGGAPLGIVPLTQACALHGIVGGLELEARLTVYDKDFAAEDAANSVEVEPQEEDTGTVISPAVAKPDGTPLGANKRRILQAISLRSLKELAGQEHLSRIVARHRVRFEEF